MSDDREYEYGRGAEMLIARHYLGLERGEMATVLRIRESSYQRWENGRDAIPTGIWDEIQKLYDRFDAQVSALIAEVSPAGGDPHPVRVWRGSSPKQQFPGLWARIVGEARRRQPRIVPVYPDGGDE
ncbi:hypothetical protein [Nocardia sp. R6R-6]|uniref:hypothetical protein n=1 Tax=Nocardia sp. R6R-6 TaxID=3459303 RepID=UPI00403DCD6C